MRIAPLAAAAALLAATVLEARPPREESPAPRDLVGAPALGAEDDMAAALAAAAAHPLGSPQNPVRVGGPLGERAYLARLRCADGSLPKVGERSNGGVGAFGSLVGVYRLDCPGAGTSIAFDFYHEEHREERAPQGLRIEPR